MIKDGRLHSHSFNSVLDVAYNEEQMAARIEELGARAWAITDHGTVTGWIRFENAAKKHNFKPIFGVEAYVRNNESESRKHLIILAMDNQGLQAISLAVTASNRPENIVQVGKTVYPCMNDEILREHFGPGSIGHGHVIMTSACIIGVLAGAAVEAEEMSVQLKDLREKLDSYERLEKDFEFYTKRLTDLQELRAQAEELISAGKGYERRKRIILKREEGEAKTQALSVLEKEHEDAEFAVNSRIQVMADIKKTRSIISGINKKRNPEAFEKLKEEFKSVEQIDKSYDEIIEMLHEKARYYDELAGHGNFFIEVQYHGLEIEKKWEYILDGIAHEMGIPTVAANDEHILRKEDAEARTYLNGMRFLNWKEPDCGIDPDLHGDQELYYKDDEELKFALSKIISAAHAQEAIDNIGGIIDRCNATIEKGKYYPKFDATWSKEQCEQELEKMAREGIASRYPIWTKELEDRLVYELGIINSMGFTDYFLIVQWYLNVGRKLGHMPEDRLDYLNAHMHDDEFNTLDSVMAYIEADQSNVGLTIGPGRGSAAGSLVCYLTGITSIDPIKFGLMMERFLNPERVSMPDIDADFSKSVRDVVIEIVKKKFGNDGVCGIMTRGTLAAKAALQMTAKVHGSRVFGDSKALLDLGSQMSDLVDEKAFESLSDAEPKIIAKFRDDQNAMEILKIAKQLENTYNQTGQHAAGVVIANNGDIKQQIPLMLDPKKGSWKSQQDKEEVEKYGHLKMDFLGLENLDIITETSRMIIKYHPELKAAFPDMERLPIEKEVIELFANGDTDFVFQFESSGMKSMLTRFKPTSFNDIGLLVACYRPGPIQYLDGIIATKHDQVKQIPDSAVRRIASYNPEFAEIVSPTYNAIVYQEQVMLISQVVGGYTLGQADILRRAMGHKEMAVLLAEEPRFVGGCISHGIKESDAKALFEELKDFAKYSFNKSHAFAYAQVAYITAWLKVHFPAEYHAVVMAHEAQEAMADCVEACTKRGIPVHCPDINISEEALIIHNGQIYFGLSNVKGVAAAASEIVKERAKGEFTGIENFLTRTNCKKNVFEALINSGAFDSFQIGRSTLLNNAVILCEAVRSLQINNEKIAVKENILETFKVNEEAAILLNKGKKISRKTLENSIESLKGKIDEAEKILSLTGIAKYSTNKSEDLKNEKEVLGIYVSGSLIDDYLPVCITIDNGETTNWRGVSDRAAMLARSTSDDNRKQARILGYVLDVQTRTSKKTSKPFFILQLETQVGAIKAMCFHDLDIKVGDVYIFNGTIGGREEVGMLTINKVNTPTRARIAVKMNLQNVLSYIDLVDEVKKSPEEKTCLLTYWYDSEGNRRSCDLPLPKSIAIKYGAKIV